MSYPTIPPANFTEATGAGERAFNAIVSSLFVRALTAAVLVGAFAKLGATVAGLGDLA